MMTWKIFRQKGLKRLSEDDDSSGFHLDRAHHPSDLHLPGYRLHALRGDPKSYWSLTISCNCRVLFRFFDGNSLEVVENGD